MVEIKRDRYLQQLIESRQNGLVKVVTGIRRCGKSYLLAICWNHFLSTRPFAMISKAKSISTRFQSIIFLT